MPLVTVQSYLDSLISGYGDPYFNNVGLLMHMDGANNGTSFSDVKGNTVTRNGAAITSTAQVKYGTASAKFSGASTEYLEVPNNGNMFTLGTQDFTFECWIYKTSAVAASPGEECVFSTFQWSSGYAGGFKLSLFPSDIGFYAFSGATLLNAGTALPLNQWNHIAVTRSGNTFRLFLNGVQKAAASNSGSITMPSAYPSKFRIATFFGDSGTPSSPFAGYIDDFRFTLGVCRYTADFTLPAAAYPDVYGYSSQTVNGDPNFNNVSLLMHMDGANNGTTFFDVKGNIATRNGSAVTSTTKYQFGTASLLLNGTTDYLTIPQTSAFDFGTGDFTIEFWVNFNTINGENPLIGLGNGAVTGSQFCGWFVRYQSSGTLMFYRFDGTQTQYTFSTTFNANTWYHVAVCRSGNSLLAFVNGNQVGTTQTTSLTLDHVNTDPLYIGRMITGAGTIYTSANIDELRITKGVARYVSNFTAPQTAFPDVLGTVSILPVTYDPYFSNVKFLMHANGADSSTSFTDVVGNIINNTGVVVDGTVNKFGGGSAKFAGTNTSFLSVPSNPSFDFGSNDFTIEFWMNPTSIPDIAHSIVGKWPTSWLVYLDATTLQLSINNGTTVVQATGQTWTFGTWYHVAITRSGSTWTIWLNGSSIATATSSATINFGNEALIIGKNGSNNRNYVSGRIDDLRITNGVARYTSAFTPSTTAFPDTGNTSYDPYINYVKLLMHMNGSNGGTSFPDVDGKTVTAGGGATTSTVQYKSGTASAYFATKTDYLQLPTSTDFNFAGDFTIEAWVYPTALHTTGWGIIDARTNGSTSTAWVFSLTNVSGLYRPSFYNGTTFNGTSTSIALNTWTHVALVRSGTTVTFYVNGTADATTFTLSGTLTSGNNPIIGSKDASLAGYGTLGYMDEVRITNGVARYTSAFTAQDMPFADYAIDPLADPYFDNVTLLMHMEGSNGGTTFTDVKGHTMSRTNVTTSTSQFKYGASSASFNGAAATNILTTTMMSDFDFGVDNFTVEGWIYYTALPTQTAAWSGGTFATWGVIWETGTPSASDGHQFRCNNTQIAYGYNDTTILSGAHGMAINTWYHVAVTRAGGTMRIFVNGQQVASATFATALPVTLGSTMYVGNETTNGATHNGYIDELRVTKGIARYTTNFAPPPYAYSDTGGPDIYFNNNTLLLHMNGSNGAKTFIDQSNNVTTVTPNTNTALTTAFARFGTASCSIGTSGYLSAPNSIANVTNQDFTAEGWFYFTTNSAGYQPLMGNTGTADLQGWIIIIETNNRIAAYASTNGTSWTNAITTTYTPPINQWVHVAYTRTGGMLRLFVDGVLYGTNSIGTGTIHSPSGSFRIGQYPFFPGGARSLAGYIDEVRITMGVQRYYTTGTTLSTQYFVPPQVPFGDGVPIPTDPYASNVVALLHCDPQATFLDLKGHTFTANGSAATNTASYKFNGGSMITTSGYAASGTSTDWTMPGDFTAELWVSQTASANPNSVISLGTYTNGVMFRNQAADGFYVNGTNPGNFASLPFPQDGSWNHVAIVRSGSVVTLYINGVSVRTVTTSATINSTGAAVVLGASAHSLTERMTGSIDEVRITKGVARYTANFTPPTSRFDL